MALIDYCERRGTREKPRIAPWISCLKNRLLLTHCAKRAPCARGGGASRLLPAGRIPFFLQYDIVSGLIAVARAGRFGDGRESGAFNSMLAMQNPDGSFPTGRREPGMPGGDKKNGGDPWVTLNALRFLDARRARACTGINLRTA
jgi:hypothetical protein